MPLWAELWAELWLLGIFAVNFAMWGVSLAMLALGWCKGSWP